MKIMTTVTSVHPTALRSFAIPGRDAPAGTSVHPLLIGASPGTTGSMSLYYALVALGVSAVHYTRQFNATSGHEWTSMIDIHCHRQ